MTKFKTNQTDKECLLLDHSRPTKRSKQTGKPADRRHRATTHLADEDPPEGVGERGVDADQVKGYRLVVLADDLDLELLGKPLDVELVADAHGGEGIRGPHRRRLRGRAQQTGKQDKKYDQEEGMNTHSGSPRLC